ncbi:MAG: hypothetical protein RBT52_06010 [Sulfurimonas sp.]|nr:hypothetical protein [Sulfurimonas sp.]
MDKKIIFTAVLVMVFCGAAFAGTTDTLGMSGLWAKVQAILTDQYLQPIIMAGFLGAAVVRAHQSHVYQGITAGALALIVGQIDSIAQAMAGAMI